MLQQDHADSLARARLTGALFAEARSYYQSTMAYRMKMFKSQKPSSFDLRVSDFKRIPGFNYVLSVSTEHTYNSLAQGKRENIWRSMPNLARAAAREAKIPAASSPAWPLGP